MDEKQQALYDELAAVVDIPVGENPLQNTKQAIVMAERHKILWRWAKDGPYYEFRWTPAHPPIKIPESQANVYLVKRIIKMMTAKLEEAPVGAEYDVELSEAATKLLNEAEMLEFAGEIVGTGKDGNILVKDVKAFIKANG